MMKRCERVLSTFGHAPHDARDIEMLFDSCVKSTNINGDEYQAISFYIFEIETSGILEESKKYSREWLRMKNILKNRS